MKEIVPIVFPLIAVAFMTRTAITGLRQMSAPDLSLGQRKIIGVRMAIYLALMALVTAAVVLITSYI